MNNFAYKYHYYEKVHLTISIININYLIIILLQLNKR